MLGMVQAATSINEQTLTFVPKLIVVAVCLAIFGGSILVLMAISPRTSSTGSPSW